MENVRIRITGTHGEGRDRETVVTECDGWLYEKNGKHYLRYTEKDAASGQERKALIKVEGGTVTVEYKGNTDTVMIFEVGRKNRSMYRTPLGSMMLETYTKFMEIKTGESSLDIEIDYLMSLGGGEPANASINIKAG
ncbi:MAG: DUF1934 domain-containing protein [Lachnospiraceae bacterium]|nr:DUF1934 domain-containing protein [Lachnospiraceae bacterium]